MMFDIIAEDMLVAIDRMVRAMRPVNDRFIDWLRDSTEPPEGLELRARRRSVHPPRPA